MHKKGRLCIYMTFLAAVILLSCLPVCSYAQPKALGATFTYSGCAISYEHQLQESQKSFIELNLKAECGEFTSERASRPGVSASLTWTSVLKQWESIEGNAISIFAGPGVIIGYGNDYKTAEGTFFGIKGRAGVECEFSRNVIISASLSPVVGSHIIYNHGLMSMKYYKNGLIYSLVPEIGIKYRF